ncbi:MAG TPA: DUF5995 family protein [Pyrinomonadaceae bacterium]|jgi:hypothetical protein
MSQNTFDMPLTDQRLVQVISASVVNSIEDVINVMRGLDNILQNNDGLKWFNLLYLRVTEGVRDSPPAERWENQQYVERLAVIFAGLYFSAIASWQRDHDRVVRSWAPLFRSRQRSGIARVQFAIAGMNAHINHDLPIALVQTSEEQDIVPRRGSPEHRDFERVNAILEVVAEQVKQFLATGIVGEIDQDLGRLDDVVALWSVRKARETAYTNGEILWQLRAIPTLSDAFLRNLDRLVGLSSRGLLVPTF